jgi:hypothetical protein
MSLDVSLIVDAPVIREHSGIFIRENGSVREISRDDWDERNPGHEPTIADQMAETDQVYSGNITHNLNTMAEAAGIYKHLWRPDEIGIELASQLIEPLRAGLKSLRDYPETYKQFNPENGWGDYDGLVRFVAGYLAACEQHPDARVSVSR